MKKNLLQGVAYFASLFLLFGVMSARAQTDAPKPPTPATLAGGKVIDTTTAK